MGQAKRAWMEHQDNIAWAKGLLVKTGAATSCQFHEELTDNLDPGAVEEAIKLARRSPPEDVDSEAAEKLVREALDDIGTECSGCASWERD